jgi:aryl-alcohol dehydrogenase-like predicted oxidoreductase
LSCIRTSANGALLISTLEAWSRDSTRQNGIPDNHERRFVRSRHEQDSEMTDTPAFSRVMLGTVQFGLDYGIANRNGQPDYRTCRDIVAGALEAGINAFDTAALYGQSEDVLGRILSDLHASENVLVVSKSRPVHSAGISSDKAEATIEASLRASLRNLKLERLAVFLFHREDDLAYADALSRMQEKGLVGCVGVSADTRGGADRAAETGKVQAVQLPHNLLDRRFAPGPLLGRLRARGVLLFARSAFLQGLLLMPEERIPGSLQAVVPVRRRLEALAREYEMGMAELCLRYGLSFPEITSVLIGVDSPAQLRENVAAMRRGPLTRDVLDRIHACVPAFPEAIVRPALWEKTR